MKIGDIEWEITPLIDMDGRTLFGYEVVGRFHEFKRAMVIPADFIRSAESGDPIERTMQRLAYELEVTHSRMRGHL